MADPAGCCACALSHPKDIPNPLTYPGAPSRRAGHSLPRIRVQSQALGTAYPSALMLEAQEKSQACQCQKHGLGAHFFFPRAGEGMKG